MSKEKVIEKLDEQIFKKASPRVLAIAGSLIVVSLIALSIAGTVQKVKKYRAKYEAEQDKVTDMTLIDAKGNVTEKGYAGLMFFSHPGNTNQADAVMHYVTADPTVIEQIRHLKLGDKKKVSEWKSFAEQKYIKTYSWHKLTNTKE